MVQKVFSFMAQQVSALKDIDAGYWMVAFAKEKKSNPKTYLILQRSIETTEEEKKLGQDNYYYEICGPDSSGYGGMVEAVLTRDNLTIKLSSHLATRYKVGKIVVQIKIEDSLWDELRKGLTRIFKDSDCHFTTVIK